MSIPINVTNKGIAQIYEREIGVERGYITGNTNRYAEFIADVNLALDDYLTIALPASGKWQYDDSNHSKYPQILTDLVASQRDYNFTTDEEGALILDFYRVFAADEGGTFRELQPKDQQSDDDTHSFYDGNDSEGVPIWYDKTANGIFLDPIPSYNSTKGLKIWINREAHYFTTSDTTEKPGVPGLHHKYFALKPALDYARRNSQTNEASLRNEVLTMERDIKAYFGGRERDVAKTLQDKSIKYRQYV